MPPPPAKVCFGQIIRPATPHGGKTSCAAFFVHAQDPLILVVFISGLHIDLDQLENENEANTIIHNSRRWQHRSRLSFFFFSLPHDAV